MMGVTGCVHKLDSRIFYSAQLGESSLASSTAASSGRKNFHLAIPIYIVNRFHEKRQLTKNIRPLWPCALSLENFMHDGSNDK